MILEELERRGLVHTSSDLDGVLDQEPIGVYAGFDPTADSLHVGHLLGQITLRRMQLAGHRPVVLAGGATGMIGDPSGRSDERNLLDAVALEHNVAEISKQLTALLDFEAGPFSARLVNNLSWTSDMSLLTFLRDVGKHFTVAAMLDKDSVASRLASQNGLSFTEFSYMLLQANDFDHLYQHEGVRLQIGGSDQWGNITAGMELIRRRRQGRAHGLVWPLVTKADGTKFGKTADGAVWLDPKRTSPFRFSQFWMQLDDASAVRLLPRFSLKPFGELDAVLAEHADKPGRNVVGRCLAEEMTTLVHGRRASLLALEVAVLLFSGDVQTAPAETLAAAAAEVGTIEQSGELDLPLVKALTRSGLATSNRDARQKLHSGAVKVNGRPTTDRRLDRNDLLCGRFVAIKCGRSHRFVVLAPS